MSGSWVKIFTNFISSKVYPKNPHSLKPSKYQVNYLKTTYFLHSNIVLILYLPLFGFFKLILKYIHIFKIMSLQKVMLQNRVKYYVIYVERYNLCTFINFVLFSMQQSQQNHHWTSFANYILYFSTNRYFKGCKMVSRKKYFPLKNWFYSYYFFTFLSSNLFIHFCVPKCDKSVISWKRLLQ